MRSPPCSSQVREDESFEEAIRAAVRQRNDHKVNEDSGTLNAKKVEISSQARDEHYEAMGATAVQPKDHSDLSSLCKLSEIFCQQEVVLERREFAKECLRACQRDDRVAKRKLRNDLVKNPDLGWWRQRPCLTAAAGARR